MDTSRVKEILEAIKTPEDEERMMSLVGGVIANRGLGLLCHLMNNMGISQLAIPFPLLYEPNSKTNLSLEFRCEEKLVVLHVMDEKGVPKGEKNTIPVMLNQDPGPYLDFRITPLLHFMEFLQGKTDRGEMTILTQETINEEINEFLRSENLCPSLEDLETGAPKGVVRH